VDGKVPDQVGIPSLTSGDTNDTFSWSAPFNGGLTIIEYGYQISSDNGTSWYNTIDGTLNAESTTVNLSVILNTFGKTSSYKIRVRARNALGWGPYSSISSGTQVWVAGSPYTVYSGTCGNRQSASRTDYTRSGSATTYSVTGAYSSSPDCNSTCFTSSTSTVNCGADCGEATRTTYTANSGSNCTTYSSDGSCTAGAGWDNIADGFGTSGTYAGIAFQKINASDVTMNPATNSQCAPAGTYGTDRVTADTGCCGGSELRYYWAYRCPTSANGSDRWVLRGCGQQNAKP
jgi:hypothetical protein